MRSAVKLRVRLDSHEMPILELRSKELWPSLTQIEDLPATLLGSIHPNHSFKAIDSRALVMGSLLRLIETALVRLGGLHVAAAHSWGVRGVMKEVAGLRAHVWIMIVWFISSSCSWGYYRLCGPALLAHNEKPAPALSAICHSSSE